MAVPSRFAVWVNRRILKAIPDETDTLPLVAASDGVARRTTFAGLRSRIQALLVTGHGYHDDIQGILQTALNGVTQYTMRQYRSTGVVMPHIAKSDVFSMIFQMPHRKRLDSPIDSVHLHYIPVASANGNIKITYSWGWYNTNDTVPNTLPNTGFHEWTLASADQYKGKLEPIITNLSPPTSEGYSSILYATLTRVTPDGTDWGSGELALPYMDAHFISDRLGSYYEATD